MYHRISNEKIQQIFLLDFYVLNNVIDTYFTATTMG